MGKFNSGEDGLDDLAAKISKEKFLGDSQYLEENQVNYRAFKQITTYFGISSKLLSPLYAESKLNIGSANILLERFCNYFSFPVYLRAAKIKHADKHLAWNRLVNNFDNLPLLQEWHDFCSDISIDRPVGLVFPMPYRAGLTVLHNREIDATVTGIRQVYYAEHGSFMLVIEPLKLLLDSLKDRWTVPDMG